MRWYRQLADTVSPEVRSRMMAAIKSRDTKPEVVVRSFLHKAGFRFRKNVKDLPGRPDIVLPKYRTVVFVHGCFWHRHEGCRYATMPKSNKGFWREKFAANRKRDQTVRNKLFAMGWRVMVVWECQIEEGRLIRLANEIQHGAVPDGNN
ncbi:MAG: DNA mismatch endonuclease Vsr [Bacteroidetes bacterium]|nr:MAG: DNA mismatch endonuclease Vsr [Bacteroidota bacterium]